MSVFFKLDPIKLAEALESIGWSGGGGGDASIAYSATAPIAPSNGDLWYDTANTKLKLYSGGLWVSMSLSQAEYNSIMGVISTLSESLANADASATKAEEEATLAENAKDAILGMQVATGVAGSSVTWNGTTLTVPQGLQGIKGDSVTDVSSSKVGKTTTVNVYVEGALENAFTVLDGADGEVSTAQLNTAIAGITKTSLGLANVDNTSDANKPVSTAQATAIALKADTGHSHADKQDTLVSGTNIKTINGTSVLGGGDIVISSSKNYEFIGKVVASNATSIVFSGLPTGYQRFIVIADGCYINDNGGVYVQFSYNNGTNFSNVYAISADFANNTFPKTYGSSVFLGTVFNNTTPFYLTLLMSDNIKNGVNISFNSKEAGTTEAYMGWREIRGDINNSTRINCIKFTAQGAQSRTFTGTFYLFGIKE